MPTGIKQKFLPISLFCIVCSATLGLETKAEVTNGADIYCFMRNGGNVHDPSWEAAYQFIKERKQGLFKTSPRQAATIIVEQVVRDPIKYENCTKYLGDLYLDRTSSNNVNELEDDMPSPNESTEKTPKGKYIDPYDY